MSDKGKLKNAYQTMVNEMTLALSDALAKKDFALLEILRVPAGTVFMELAEGMVGAEIISEEQALSLYHKFTAMEDKMDEEERLFEMDAEVSRDVDSDIAEAGAGPGPSLSMDDLRELPEELW